MTRPADKHLTPEELDTQVSGIRQDQLLRPGVGDGGGVSTHLSQCDKCRTLVEVYSGIEKRLTNLRQIDSVPPSKDCPPDVIWPQVLARAIPEERASEAIAHAAACDHCGILLKSAVDIFDEQLSPEEELLLGQLESSRPHWQESIVERLILESANRDKPSVATVGKRVLTAWKIFAFASAIVVLLVASGWIAVNELGLPLASHLITEAYGKHRTVDMRFSGAKYGPVRVERVQLSRTLTNLSPC